ncbi:DUF1240 domain-containing protein [Rahnella inusitata]|jgi:hypothetical protein|uniref:DUF1240 domain-containing protein n=1 Tax=Rahnella inusitata TaxID=58169 RepID=UPI0039BE9083
MKIRSFSSLFILFSTSLLSLYFWINEITNYLEFRHVITFSWMSIGLVCIPIIFTFPICWFFLECIYERNVAIEKMEKLMPYFKYLCIFSFVLIIFISLGYISILEHKGYISCQESPSGWMPGTAKKYAISIQLCGK